MFWTLFLVRSIWFSISTASIRLIKWKWNDIRINNFFFLKTLSYRFKWKIAFQSLNDDWNVTIQIHRQEKYKMLLCRVCFAYETNFHGESRNASFNRSEGGQLMREKGSRRCFINIKWFWLVEKKLSNCKTKTSIQRDRLNRVEKLRNEKCNFIHNQDWSTTSKHSQTRFFVAFSIFFFF